MTSTDFPRAYRLLTPKDYQPVFKQPDVKISTQHFLLLAKKNHLPHPRLGLAITKKKAQLAVVRNHIKRHIRNSFRTHKTQLNNYDIIFLLRKNINKENLATIPAEIQQCIEQLLAKQV